MLLERSGVNREEWSYWSEVVFLEWSGDSVNFFCRLSPKDTATQTSGQERGTRSVSAAGPDVFHWLTPVAS